MNQNPEQKARDVIDAMLMRSGWHIQNVDAMNLNAAKGVAVREYPTEVGFADYLLFVDNKPVGVIEAKREEDGHRITTVEEQSVSYATSRLKWMPHSTADLRFVYESTGVVTRFCDRRDPRARSRPVFSFHRPEVCAEWLREEQQSEKTLRGRLCSFPPLTVDGLRDCQIQAVTQLEKSFCDNRPRALLQMATGSGKTFTAITAIYRLLRYAGARRVLFLVDTKNLGEQAEQEFMAYTPNDTNRKFTELYTVQRLKSSYIAPDSNVCISTIQRLYSLLKGEELDDSAEVVNPNEYAQPRAPMPVVYNERIPVEFFDVIVVDECHRSIYNVWTQVLEYFDAFLVGLTATPDKRTFGFFNENLVSEYSSAQAIADGVNVGYDVYRIETEITQQGALIPAAEIVQRRDKLTRKKRWEQLDEDQYYTANSLDRDVVNPSQIRKVIHTFREKLPEMFPGRKEVPKTLIFAKTDSHADDIIAVVREEFGEGNEFCKKVTYNATDPKGVLAQFRNSYHPRIAVTVDMIATGTDVKPLECLLFMRDVKSGIYYDQMKGRGTRTMDGDDLKKVTPSAVTAKTHFVLIDAVGVTNSVKTANASLERKPSVPLKDLIFGVMLGARDEDVFLSLASRLVRIERTMSPDEHEQFAALAGGKSINTVARALLDAVDADVIEQRALLLRPDTASEEESLAQAREQLADEAASLISGPMNSFLEDVRREHEQMIDHINIDHLIDAGWSHQADVHAEQTAADFRAYIEAHKDEIAALGFFYDQPYRRRALTYAMVKEVLAVLKRDKPALAPAAVWKAYAHLDRLNTPSPASELTALVALLRRATGMDDQLTTYGATVDKNFQRWVMHRHRGNAPKFTEAQMAWLRLLKDHVASSISIGRSDLDYTPFDALGGLGAMWELFGDDTDALLDELNRELAA